MDEGVVTKETGGYTYEYFLKDQLGNVRMVFKPGATGPIVLQKTDYYPFGMAFYNQVNSSTDNKCLYNGKEIQSSLDLGWYDYGARFYDPQIGRWTTLDPLAEVDYSGSPLTYVSNSPINLIDQDGRFGTDFKDESDNKTSFLQNNKPPVIASSHTDENGNVLAVYNDGDLGVYVHIGARTRAEIDEKRKRSGTKSGGGQKKGETYFWDEFRTGDRILFGQSWNSELVELAIDGCNEGKGSLAWNTRSGHKYDIKSRYARGTGKMFNGKYISAECAGNFLAGINAGGRNDLSFIKYMQLAGAYHQTHNLSGPASNGVAGTIFGSYPWYGEIDYAGRMIVWGWLTKAPQDREAIDASDYYYSTVKK